MAEDIAERSVVSWSMADKHNRATQRLGAYGSVRYQSAKRHMADGFAKQGLSRIAIEYFNGKSMDKGLIGYLTLGVDSRASYAIENPNFHDAK